MARVLVTGYKGFIGSELVKYLGDHDFVGLDIKDGQDKNILTCELPEDIDIVIHLAAEPGVVASVANPYKNAETNILGTIRLAEHYRNSRFIFASSGGTIQETIESPYGLSKHTCEQYIKLLCKDYVILRFPNVYGKGSRSVVDKWLNEETLIIYGDGKTCRIYCHISDVVRAVVQSLSWPKGTYKLGTDQRYSVMEVARIIAKPIIFEPARTGEITHTRSQLPNTTPNWKAETDLEEYIDAFYSNTKP